MPRCGIAPFALQQPQIFLKCSCEISAGSFQDNLPGAESRSGGSLSWLGRRDFCWNTSVSDFTAALSFFFSFFSLEAHLASGLN